MELVNFARGKSDLQNFQIFLLEDHLVLIHSTQNFRVSAKARHSMLAELGLNRAPSVSACNQSICLG